MNKKILAILMAMLMILTSVAALADDEPTTQVVKEETSFILKKTYNGDGRDAETFKFELSNAEGNKGPELKFADNKNTLEFLADDITSRADDVAQSLTINVPAVGVTGGYEAVPGTYDYILKETTEGTNNADIEYDKTEWFVKVTVYNAAVAGADPEYKTTLSIRKGSATGVKNDTADFVNTYEAPNTLTVKKQIAGNMAVSTDTFTIQVTITDKDGNPLALAKPVEYTPSVNTITVSLVDEENGVYEIQRIGHNGYVTFTNLPQGAKYVVNEPNPGDYKASYDGYESGTVTENQEITTVVTNTKNVDIDTGVTTDNMPYIMLMAFAMMIAAAVLLKKRTVND